MRLSQALTALCVSFATAEEIKYNGPDYESLPNETLFPGPWEANIRAPLNKSHIVPVKIFNHEGPVAGGWSMLQNAGTRGATSDFWYISRGGLITFEFAESIAGK